MRTEQYHSSTYAFFDDETHSSIRRTYTSPSETHSKRQFCGFCGTPLTFWSESSPTEAEHICLTLGSLTGQDLRDLEELGLLPKEALDDAQDDKEKIDNVIPFAGSNTLNGAGNEGLPWFQTMVEVCRHFHWKGRIASELSLEAVASTSDGVDRLLTSSQGSRLGKVSRGHGERRIGNGRYTVEWEITEWNDGDPEPEPSSGKRKLGDLGAEDDTKMQH